MANICNLSFVRKIFTKTFKNSPIRAVKETFNLALNQTRLASEKMCSEEKAFSRNLSHDKIISILSSEGGSSG